MSNYPRFAVIIMIAALFSSGCCLTQPCGLGGGCGSGTVGPIVGCSDGSCGAGGCDSCAPSGRGCLLGLGCIGRLFQIGDYNCSGGCGEVYYHDWISDPPSGGDPCDCHGKFTGVPAGPCGGASCGGGCGGGCIAGPGCGAAGPIFGSGPAQRLPVVNPGVIIEPDCGAAFCDSGPTCGIGGGPRGGCMVGPGRMLFSTWTGLGGAVREIGRGLFPYRECGYANCGLSNCDGSCGGRFVTESAGNWGCDSCSNGCASCASTGGHVGTSTGYVATPAVTTHAEATARLPHKVVTRQIRQAHSRPPHRVVTTRLR